MAKKREETEFDKLARLIKEEGEDIRGDLGGRIDSLGEGFRKEMLDLEKGLERRMDEGFSAIIRRLDGIIQMQLDAHASRLGKLETAVFSK